MKLELPPVEFPVSYGEPTTTVDEESFQEFLSRMKRGITSEYIDTLEELYIQKTRVCDMYAEIIGAQDKELLQLREKIASIEQIQTAMKMQNNRMQDCRKVFEEYDAVFRGSWAARLRRSLKRLLPHRRSSKHWDNLE